MEIKTFNLLCIKEIDENKITEIIKNTPNLDINFITKYSFLMIPLLTHLLN